MRVCKTRAIAASACRRGRVRVGEVVAKAARELKVGEVVTWREGPETRIFKVVGFPDSRVGAKLVPDYCEDRTPRPPEPEQQKAAGEGVWARERGAGRPTKRDRRRLEDMMQES